MSTKFQAQWGDPLVHIVQTKWPGELFKWLVGDIWYSKYLVIFVYKADFYPDGDNDDDSWQWETVHLQGFDAQVPTTTSFTHRGIPLTINLEEEWKQIVWPAHLPSYLLILFYLDWSHQVRWFQWFHCCSQSSLKGLMYKGSIIRTQQSDKSMAIIITVLANVGFLSGSFGFLYSDTFSQATLRVLACGSYRGKIEKSRRCKFLAINSFFPLLGFDSLATNSFLLPAFNSFPLILIPFTSF